MKRILPDCILPYVQLSVVTHNYFTKDLSDSAATDSILYRPALLNVSLTMYRGEIFGLLGHNGAGNFIVIIFIGILSRLIEN